MTAHSESRIVPYTADLMYRIVADVEKYPEFLPWVSALHITAREHAHDKEILKAHMTVGFKSFRESYTSRVVLDPAAHAIDVVQAEGPFRQLENHWRFTPQGDRCKVDFSIAFELRNPVLNMVVGTAFGRVLLKTQDAFLQRARALSKKAL